MNKLAGSAASLFLLLLTACGGGANSNNNNPPPPPVTISANVVLNSTTTPQPFNLAMSTSFQPAEWDDTFFQTSPSAKQTLLGNLQPQHIRLQGISRGVPQGMNDFSSTAWDFSTLDSIVQPVLNVGDHSPEFQIAKGPAFMYQNNNNNSTNNVPNSFLDLTFQQFAGYAKNLVQYYNTGGFTPPGGSMLVSAAYPNDKITWWGIYNEPSINNNLDEGQYTTMYNAVVPAMRSVDPSIKFVAMELCCGSEGWVSYFASNVTAQVDAVATHYYSSCNQRDTDAQLMATVPGFASSVQTIYAGLSTNAALSGVPVWITENNVNADFNAGNNMSACNPGQAFVTDQRGTSAFFAAWRPYVFSQVGKAGAQALYHWDFDADAQYGEVDYNTGNTMLSYWVDYWLGQYFLAGSGAGQQLLLDSTNSNTAQVEVLPVLNPDGSVVIMISNHAVASPADNNGVGMTANISIDTSAFGSFNSALSSKLVIDSTTSATTGPTATSISAASPIQLTLNGYSVAFIKLVP